MECELEKEVSVSPYEKNPLLRLVKYFIQDNNASISEIDKVNIMNLSTKAYLETMPILSINNLECLAHKTISLKNTKVTLSDSSEIVLDQNLASSSPLILQTLKVKPSSLIAVYENESRLM